MPDTRTIVEGNTAFAADLYRSLKAGDANLFLSPYSISAALAMVFAGARGATEKQMADVLHFAVPQQRLHPAFQSVQDALARAQGEGVILREANSIWPDTAYDFRKKYLELVEKFYRGAILPVDYRRETEAARQKINAWVEERTEQKIRELILPAHLSALTRLVLVNAIYFKGAWQSAFKVSGTSQEPFWVSAVESLPVPMMKQTGYFRTAGDKAAQMLELPYKGRNLSMFILLPAERDGLAGLESSLDAGRLKHWLKACRDGDEVQVSLPRFRLDCKFSLKDTLVALGMTDAFEEKLADFSGMDGTRELLISDAIHQAFVDVNEAGTEAAAATAVVLRAKSIPVEPLVFRADHPFLFLIRENGTGSILFMGRVTRP